MLDEVWYGKSGHFGPGTLLSLLLAPLGWLYYLIAKLRRSAYKKGLLKSEKLPVIVIVVGNLTVGGTGKTPLVMWLIRFLKKQGYNPGIISRGYGGKHSEGPYSVTKDSDPLLVGDEPVLLARHCHCPVYIDSRRARAGQALLNEHTECNVIICDDGLQHYALERDLEICVIDSLRGHGNGRCLPAGPLREPVSRLENVDLAIYNGGTGGDDFNMRLLPDQIRRVDGSVGEKSVSDFIGSEVHALAGIGNPQRFFQFLRSLNLLIKPHKFKDHHVFSRSDIDFQDQLPVIMTEKDAVKCKNFADQRHWFLQIQPQLSEKNGEQFGDRLLSILKNFREE